MIKHFIDLDNLTKTELRNILSFATKKYFFTGNPG